MKSIVLSLLLAWSVAAEHRLSQREAKTLIENIPDFINAARAHRCPKAELLWTGEKGIAFQIRSLCTKSPSGLIGNFVVDRETADVWVGIDHDQLIESDHLRRLQEKFRNRIKRNRDGK